MVSRYEILTSNEFSSMTTQESVQVKLVTKNPLCLFHQTASLDALLSLLMLHFSYYLGLVVSVFVPVTTIVIYETH